MTARHIRPPAWLIRALAYDPQLPASLQRLFKFFSHWLGYRGFVLIAFGGMWLFIGVGLVLHPNFDPNLRHTYLPLWFRFTVWGVCGVIACVTGIMRSGWKPLGFSALFIGPAERCLSFLWALITTWNPFYVAGAGLYFVLTLTILVFSAWPEPPDRIGR